MWTSPGFAEKGWTPPGVSKDKLNIVEQQGQLKTQAAMLEVETFYLPRWCHQCQNFKPPRSHHCRDLNTCVLKLDHYCPWVYNAVGYRNHKFFFQFLFYSSVSLSYFLICCVVRVVLELRHATRYKFPFSIVEIVLLIMQLVLTLPVTIGIASLFFYQLSCIRSNLTSIETFTYKRFKKGARLQSLKNFKWFYDFGSLHNFREVLGYTITEWFVPTIPKHIREGDGAIFKTRTLEEIGLPPVQKELQEEQIIQQQQPTQPKPQQQQEKNSVPTAGDDAGVKSRRKPRKKSD